MSIHASTSTPDGQFATSSDVSPTTGIGDQAHSDRSNVDPQNVAKPRSLGWEVVLFIATFGLYFSYYLYRVVKDFRTINHEKVSPAWWILTPYFLLAQFFAYPRLMRLLEDAESRCELSQPWGQWRKLWMLGMWVVTLLINVSDKVPDSDRWFVAVFFLGTVLFSVLHRRVNRIRTAYWKRLSQGSTLSRRYNPAEWILTVLCLPVATVLLCILLFYTQMFGGNQLEALKHGAITKQEGHPFRVKVQGDHWSRVEIGSHSDGTALLELEGANTNAYFVVFHHGKETSLNQVSAYRTDEASEEFSQTTCRENREFLATDNSNGSSIVSSLECRGTLLGNKVLVTSRSIQTDEGVYELYGQLVAAKADFNHAEGDYQETEKGFLPL